MFNAMYEKYFCNEGRGEERREVRSRRNGGNRLGAEGIEKEQRKRGNW
jgi:hypothetical protein